MPTCSVSNVKLPSSALTMLRSSWPTQRRPSPSCTAERLSSKHFAVKPLPLLLTSNAHYPPAKPRSGDYNVRMRTFGTGLLCLCLSLLLGCAAAPPSPAPTLIVNTCPTPSPCTLPAAAPMTNGDLNLEVERTEAAWAQCAAKVDAVIACHAQAHPIPELPP